MATIAGQPNNVRRAIRITPGLGPDGGLGITELRGTVTRYSISLDPIGTDLGSFAVSGDWRKYLASMRRGRVTIEIDLGGDERSIVYGEGSPAEREARAMAKAVLEGDDVAALMLADEVRERHLQGEGFVSRDALAKRVEDLTERVGNLVMLAAGVRESLFKLLESHTLDERLEREILWTATMLNGVEKEGDIDDIDAPFPSSDEDDIG